MRNAAMSLLMLLVAFTATLAPAQVSVGFLPNNAQLSSGTNAVVSFTFIDLAHRASANGEVNTLTTEWSAGYTACTNGFRVRFLRPSSYTEDTYTTVAERGPFAVGATGGFVTVALSPSVSVQQGDYLAIVIPPNCGAIGLGLANQVGSMKMLADIPASGSLDGIASNLAISARASSDVNQLDGIVAVVGSVAGGNSSNFRTSLQLSNPLPYKIQGNLVYHPAGASASGSDPSLAYTLPAYGTIAYPDVVASLGVSGLGSLDIVSNSSAPPLANAHIFNDLGVAGTSGFTESAASPMNALQPGDYAFLSEPADLTNYRMTIGIRTLSAGAAIAVVHYDSNGNKVGSTITKTYSPSYFEHVPLATFLGGAQPIANGQVKIVPTSGQVIVYGSTADNRTNDSTIYFPGRP
jgi:hypothetical protein